MRLLGIFLISAVPVLFCFWKGEEIRRKQKMRNGFLLFLEHTLFQIENFDRDQREIFLRFENADLEKAGFLPAIRSEVERDPCGAVGRIMDSFLSSFSFSSKGEEALAAFSAHFGMQAKATQLNELRRVIEILRKNGEKEKIETENKIKIVRMIGVTAGLGILILMI